MKTILSICAWIAVASTALGQTLLHFSVDGSQIEQGRVSAVDGAVSAAIHGRPIVGAVGPTDAMLLDGAADWLVVREEIAGDASLLPTRQFTAMAWVNLFKPLDYGGILGVFQDNGGEEAGWVLGFDGRSFSIGLATRDADDGDGRMTYLAAGTPYTLRRWHHLAATYDGAVLRLYVDGKPAGETREQGGDILYPASARLVIGAYSDRNEHFPLEGALRDVRLEARALSAAEVAADFARLGDLAEAPPVADAAAQFVVLPYLQFATKTSMVIRWETAFEGEALVEYGERLPYDREARVAGGRALHEVELTGLKPQTQYFYRVTTRSADGRVARSDRRTFQTAVHDDSAFAFTVIGDTQNNPKVTARVAELAYALRPNFQVHVGDVVGSGPKKQEWVEEFLRPSEPLMSRVCVYPTIGNHEEDAHWYYDYFTMPSPEYFYSFAYGNAQFFMVDTNRPITPGSEQYRWLDESLARSEATWKFVAHHHPVWSSDENDHGDTHRGGSTWGKPEHRPLAALYERHGVDLVFNGHIHMYERTWPIRDGKVDPTGVRYITTGGSGGGLEGFAPSRTWFMASGTRRHHFTYIAIHEGVLQFRVYDEEGRLFDSMEIAKPASAAGVQLLGKTE